MMRPSGRSSPARHAGRAGRNAGGMSEALLRRWVRAARIQAVRPAGGDALEQENKQLRAQLARAETERDILKKALTIFSQSTGR